MAKLSQVNQSSREEGRKEERKEGKGCTRGSLLEYCSFEQKESKQRSQLPEGS